MRMVRKCESFSFGAPKSYPQVIHNFAPKICTHPSLLILHEYVLDVKDYFKKLIHSLSTDLSTGWLI